MLHLPLLRHGEVYRSLDTAPVPDVRGEALAEVSLANPGLLRRDRRRADAAWEQLRTLPTAERVSRTQAAASSFLEAELPAGDRLIGPEEHVRLTSRATGLPHALVRRNLQKVAWSLQYADQVLRGLTRGLDPAALDTGLGEVAGVPLGLVQTARTLAAVLPSNSPGVHTLWTCAPSLGLPVILKPGRGDPWTPLRVVAALVAAGLPAEAFAFVPAEHDGGAALVEAHDRVMVFGGEETVRRYAHDPRVEVHGPGFAKILVGPDARWQDHLDVIVESVVSNGGRSCINTSTVVSDDADGLAAALAARLAALEPRDLEDPEAGLAAFSERAMADGIEARLAEAMAGARDVSAELRGPQRRVERDGLVFLRPTVVRCAADHALARTELPFPFVSVVSPPADPVGWLGPSLVVMALTDDPALRRRLLDARHVDRLHLGPVPTSRIRWDQPHEGNLFDACWRRRAVG